MSVIRPIPERAAARKLSDELRNLALWTQDALTELELGIESGDLGLQIAAAKRLESLGVLMGEAARKRRP